jgi:hypothetical protein
MEDGVATARSDKVMRRDGGGDSATEDPAEGVGDSATQDAAKGVGAELTRARESLGLSIAEIRDRTGIPWAHLQAIESMELAEIPDQRTLVVAARRYAEVVGLDAATVCGQIVRVWQAEHMRRTEAVGLAPTTAVGIPRGSATAEPHLRAFTQTAEVPALGGRSLAGSTNLVHFVDTGAVPVVVARQQSAVLRTPRLLRASVTVTALVLLVAATGLVIEHVRPKWLADLHLTRNNPVVPASPAAQTTQAPNARRTTGTTQGAGHTASTNQTVVTEAKAPGNESVSVRARSYQVVVSAQQRCWVLASVPDAAAPSGSDTVYTGVLDPGTTKVLDPAGGKLSIEFGASFVTAQVQVNGKAVPGWSFSPPTAPFTLAFSSSGGA